MGISAGVAKQVRYKKEATFNTAPGAASAQLLRRVESNISIKKDTYESNELRPDYQVSDFRHGVRKTEGPIKGELSPKTYADFIGSACRRDFATVAAIASLSLTIAVGSIVNGIQQYTVTRAAGSWLSDGVKVGHVARLTAAGLNAANASKNLLVLAETATVLTVVPLNGVALVAEGPIASSTLTLTGKCTYVPTSGHTDQSYAIEHWYPDNNISELYTGCKVNTIDISLPSTGMTGIDIGFMGAGSLTPGVAQYYTSPTAATTTGVTAAVNGVMMVAGAPVAILTGLSIKIDGGYSGDPVVGSNVLPAIFPGRVEVSGQLQAYFDSGTFRDYFLNETEISLAIALTCDNSAASEFIAFTLPRVKLGSCERTDGEKGITLTADFRALFNGAGGAGTSSEQTTIYVQDSAA